jgi:hypothetical protein
MSTRKLRIVYWVVLILLTIGMLASTLPSVLQLPYAVAHFRDVLGLPEYLLVFTGAIKLVGLVALYIPHRPQLRQWVYAGFTFDLIGAWYCNFISLHSFLAALPILVFLALLILLIYLNGRLSRPSNAL